MTEEIILQTKLPVSVSCFVSLSKLMVKEYGKGALYTKEKDGNLIFFRRKYTTEDLRESLYLRPKS